MMSPFRNCHLIVDKKLTNVYMHVCDFIDADFFSIRRYFYSIFKMDSSHKR